MFQRVADLSLRVPRRTLGLTALIMVAAGIFGLPVAGNLSAGGFGDPGSESARAAAILADTFGQSDVQMLLLVSDTAASDGINSPNARAVGTELAAQLSRSPHVSSVISAWTGPPAAIAPLVSKDGKSGLVVAGIKGGETESQKYAESLSSELARDHGTVTVRSGGLAMVNVQITKQAQRDVLLMEAIAIPLSFVVLVWVFSGLYAAALPVAIGGMSILGALAVLRVIAFTTEVSIFALNLSTALGLALAIDYTLLIVSRFRDEVATGVSREQALRTTMATAGRTVAFSATTVALSMAAMILFPMHFLRSFGYAGIATVTFTAIAALVMTPAAIVLLGDRLDALDVRAIGARLGGRTRSPKTTSEPVENGFWYRSTAYVIRRAAPVGLATAAVLVAAGTPFLGVRWGFPDDRVLPPTASARQVGDEVRRDFLDSSTTAISVVIPDDHGVSDDDLAHYATKVSLVSDVTAVSTPLGTFAAGHLVGPPSAPTATKQNSTFLTVRSSAPLFSAASTSQLRDLHAIDGPGGRAVLMTGTAQTNSDSVHAITSHLPVVLGLIAIVTFILLFLLTGSVVMPVKALVLNVLSLSAAFGAMVWIFQDHHLNGLGTASTGTLVANMPVLLFCIAFGLSMDYEVFVVSRIREFWEESGHTRSDNDTSITRGIAYTGRVVTAAALVMAISFAALIASHVSFMRMFGVGLTLAVIVDSTLVRMVLLPAVMHSLGTWCWWAPPLLKRLQHRFGISEVPHRLPDMALPDCQQSKERRGA